MAIGRDLLGGQNHVVAVIGDGALGTGMAFEALNHAGDLGRRLVVVLNDNGMAISPSIGALARYLSLLRLSHLYRRVETLGSRLVKRLPFGGRAWTLGKEVESRVERAMVPAAFWMQFGFHYLGPFNGHSIKELIAALESAKSSEDKPTLIHVVTKKGKGYSPAEDNPVKFHGVSPSNSGVSAAPSYSAVFGQTLQRLMRENDKIVVITAAMLDGTGLPPVAEEFPQRVFDVGICEQHAVTLAAGLATEGFVPVVAVYSTFLQRAYDQIIHDVCIQNLPVVFAIDRAGIVGDDGRTHQGAFDLSYLRSIPIMVVASPKDEDELQHLLFTATRAGCPMAVRFPRGHGQGVPLQPELHQLPIGRGEKLRDGQDVAILAIGTTAYPALAAAEQLAMEGVECAVVNARFAKPLDSELILEEASRTKRVVTVEENTLAAGFGSAVLELLESSKMEGVRTECIGMPDRFVEHGPQGLFRSMFELDAEGVARRIRSSFPDLPFGNPPGSERE
jgi:1-deoxy-D-xylulose-5-phosphate synthase